MKFPLSKIDIKEYHDKIYELLKDDDCRIYIDTNIIALFYGIHDSARKEFFDWLKLLIQKNRVKVPVWVINEYTNRFIRNQIQDYLSPLKKVSTIKKEFEQVSAFLKMHIEESNLPSNKYESISDFKNDLEEIEEKFEKIAFTAKNKDERYKLKIHDEINQVLGNSILSSNIDNILESTDSLGLIRYHHKLPPGFEDGKKDLNAHGDLILWYEILKDCKDNNIKKAILITDDEKKDWVYAPNRLIVNSREKSNNSKPQFKIADPRLIHEFKVATDSEEFYIISFELLTQILIENISNRFTNLASALQLVHTQSDDSDSNSDNEQNNNGASETNSESDETIAEIQVEENSSEVVFPTEIATEGSELDSEAQQLPYHSYALADKDFPLVDKTFFTKVIEQLKSYNWYIQNPAIDSVNNYDSSTLEESQSNSDSIFVLGRNIYQSACGGSGSAVDFIENLRQRFTKYSDYFINHLYNGILYEVYFDSANNFRNDNLKSYLINEVLEVLDLECLKPSISFMEIALKEYESNLLYLPYKDETIKLEIIFEDSPIQIKDWFDNDVSYLKVNEIKASGIDLLTDDEENALEIYYPNMNYAGLVDLICKTYGIPSQHYTVEVKPDIDKSLQVTMEDKKLATTMSKNNSRDSK